MNTNEYIEIVLAKTIGGAIRWTVEETKEATYLHGAVMNATFTIDTEWGTLATRHANGEEIFRTPIEAEECRSIARLAHVPAWVEKIFDESHEAGMRSVKDMDEEGVVVETYRH